VKTAIAILTYRRLHALRTMLDGLEKNCPQYPTAVFEDCGQRDPTADYLQKGRTSEKRPVLMATEWIPQLPNQPNHFNVQVFMGDLNLGVAGNSNRAIKWFMDSDCDHLCLCNDDLVVTGDFAKYYAAAHTDLGVGMFCFCDFTEKSPAISGDPATYKWVTYPWRGYKVKMLPRFTGIMMSITRALVDKIGYFDAEFGKFGEEHCDYTIRARFGGFIRMEQQDMNCLDVEHSLLTHQDVLTSMTGAARRSADSEAGSVMQRSAFEYKFRHYYRPFRLIYPKFAGGYYGAGIPCRQLEQMGYKLVTDLV
jgi:GT2 family glycosyltransferase